VIFDDPECLGDIGRAHTGDDSYPLRPARKRQLDNDFPSRLPHMRVRRTVLARWSVDDDAKPILP